MSLRIVGFSGSTRRPSRTRALIEAVGDALAARRPVDLVVHDLAEIGPGIGAFQHQDLPPAAQALLSQIERADALIVGSPVYKGSYTGLFKHVIDFLDPLALAGKPVVLTATGGGHRHALVVEHQLRPLFGFFAAQTIPTAIYASDHDFTDGVLVDGGVRARIVQAAAELDRLLPAATVALNAAPARPAAKVA